MENQVSKTQVETTTKTNTLKATIVKCLNSLSFGNSKAFLGSEISAFKSTMAGTHSAVVFAYAHNKIANLEEFVYNNFLYTSEIGKQGNPYILKTPFVAGLDIDESIMAEYIAGAEAAVEAKRTWRQAHQTQS